MIGTGPGQWSSKCGPWASILSIIWEPVRNVSSQGRAQQSALSYFKYLFIYYLLASGSSLLCAGCLQLQRAGFLFIVVHGLLTAVASLIVELRLWCRGFSTVAVHRLIVPWHVGSSWTRDRACVPSIGRRFLTTRPPGKHRNLCFNKPSSWANTS